MAEQPTTPATNAEHKLRLRTLKVSDYNAIRDIMERVYAGFSDDGAWTRKEYRALLQNFPEGQICIEDKGQIVAVALALVVQYSDYGDRHTYNQITADGTFKTHNAEGDTLYGVDVFVDPDYRGLRLGRRLYDARKELCENLNLRGIIAGGRIAGYGKYADELTPRQYIEQVRNKEITDPILTFQLSNGFHVRKIIKDYLPQDPESRGYATLLEWINVYYDEQYEQLIGNTKSNVRIGVVQWQMRAVQDVEEMIQQVEFYVDTVSSYKADLVLFPEFFNAPLMALSKSSDAPESIREMAGYTDILRTRMQEMALSYNINIIAGSMPEVIGGKLYNVAYLLRRDGTSDRQLKLHVTPDEAYYWGMRGGSKLQAFDTDFGRIGILICYDVEFPELSRLLSDQQIKILFVPFWTDTKNAYQRVRCCAMARAIENECYVAITGSVGNLPKVENMDIQYSQSAVFSPSDFAFPHDATIAEATPNTEMTLIADLDLDLLKDLNTAGSVRNLRDRRKDLYSLRWSAAKAVLEEADPMGVDDPQVVEPVATPPKTAESEALAADPVPPTPHKRRAASHHGVAAG